MAIEYVSALSLKRGVTMYTDIQAATPFYRAEEYHQKYFMKNRQR